MGDGRNVGKIHIATDSVVIPSELRVDGLLELCAARFVDTAGVYPEVSEAISGSLFPAESKFYVAALILPSALHHVAESNFFAVRTPYMGQDGIWRNAIADELSEAELAIVVVLQKAHSGKSGPRKRVDTIRLEDPR